MEKVELEKYNSYVNGGYEGDAQFENGTVGTSEKHARDTVAAGKQYTLSNASTAPDDKRDEWEGGLEFLMSCIATSVGLGNIWRFPFTAYENGGGAFLIPYIIVLLVVGKPFYYMEGLIGQFSSRSCVKVWSMSPAMKGIGYGQLVATFCVVTYYCGLMALTMYYLIASFQSVLPWSYCRDEWADVICVNAGTNQNTTSSANQTVYSSAELYFRRVVLNELNSIENGIGLPSWRLALCLLGSWISIFAVLFRGVKSSGKAAYFLAIFPYVVMIGLLIRAVTLEGAGTGILFFVTPQWDKLWSPTVWYAAITQCFFSLSVCFGPIVMYSSYNNFSHNVSRDVLVVTTLDTFTSIIAGCTIFGILGNLAHEMGVDDISDVVRGGAGLAFISYPEALSRFAVVPQLFSVLFFVMMFVLGAGSAMALAGVLFSVLSDKFPHIKHWKMVLVVCAISYLIGLIYITPGSQWMLTLVDYYGGTFVVIIIGVFEITTICWIYGLSNFINDVEFMLGHRPGLYWRLCWSFVTPVLMIVILLYTIATYEPPTYNNAVFPVYAYAIGWTILAIGVIPLVSILIYTLVKKRTSSFAETAKRAFAPSLRWGPRHDKIRREWEDFVAEKKSNNSGGLFSFYFR